MRERRDFSFTTGTRRTVLGGLGGGLGAALLGSAGRTALGAEGGGGAGIEAVGERLIELLPELRGLLRQRLDLARTLEAAELAERSALAELAGIEGTLRRLVGTKSDLLARLPAAAAEVDGLEQGLGLAETGGVAERIAGELAASRRRRAAIIDQLGQANTEISHWQLQADRAARRIGEARSRAFETSRRLAALSEQGQTRAQEASELLASPDLLLVAQPSGGAATTADPVWALLEALRQDYGALLAPATASAHQADFDPSAVWPPVLWPQSGPPTYAPPRGSIAPVLVAGAPADSTRVAGEVMDAAGGGVPWQAPLTGTVTTRYGASTPYFPIHWAVDIGSARLYAPVAAASFGRVEYVGLATAGQPQANHGMVVVLRHGARLISVYAHLDASAFGPLVRAGDEVERGQAIGHTGMTGYSTGPHLHFEVRLDNRPVDPSVLVTLGT